MNKKIEQSVLVIGGGAAGITAAYQLKMKGFEVKLIEASERLGGRIFADNTFAPFAVELGAEFIHGHRTSFYRGVKALNLPMADSEGNDYFLHDHLLVGEEVLSESGELNAFWEFVEMHHLFKGADLSVANFLKAHKVEPYLLPYFNSWCAAIGSSPERIGMSGLAKESHLWDAGDENYRLKVPIMDFFEAQIAALKDDVIFKEEIKFIKAEKDEVEAVSFNGKSYKAHFVVVTVPLSVLKRGAIEFYPALDEKKLTAMQCFGMDSGLKLILKFEKGFFQEDMGYLIGTEKINEYWTTGLGRTEQNSYLTCFATGKTAEKYTKNGLESSLTILGDVIEELDDLFNGQASANYENHIYQDWANTPFIEGAYSYPKIGARGKRKYLAETHAERVLFAGEACSTNGHAASIHGAIETAENAVAEILAKTMRK